MPTTLHLPKSLLEAIDRCAKRLKISRNRLVVQVLQKELASETGWSPGFFEHFESIDKDDALAIDEMLAAIRAPRTNKSLSHMARFTGLRIEDWAQPERDET